jgi:shikimate dehydrogenase
LEFRRCKTPWIAGCNASHPHITGTTRLYGLVGDPLTTAKSPELNRLFIEQRVDAVCVPFGVKADDLAAFVTGARAIGNLAGVLVTMPHKQRMLAFVDELDLTVRQVGALNVIRCHDDGRWVGATFDGLGCVLGMEWEGNHPANKSVLLIGAGGAGRAIAYAVASAGARTLTVFDADERRGHDLPSPSRLRRVAERILAYPITRMRDRYQRRR